MTIQKLTPPNNDDRLILRTSRLIPLGYKEHPEDKKWLVPVPQELELIKQAKEYSKTCSVREVANWLSAKLGRKVSHMWVARNCAWGKRNKKYERYEGQYEVRHYTRYTRPPSKAAKSISRKNSNPVNRQVDTGEAQDSTGTQENPTS
jgi:hypothetical protein